MNAATVSGPRSRIRSHAIGSLQSEIRDLLSVLLHRHEHLPGVAAPEQQLRQTAGRDLLSSRAASAALDTRPAVDREDDVAGTHARRPPIRCRDRRPVITRARLAGGHLQAARHAPASDPAASSRSPRRALPAAPAADCCRRLCGEFCSASRSSSSTVTVSVFSCLLRSTLTGTGVPGLRGDHGLDEVVAISSPACPLNSTITSPGSMPALAAAPPGGHRDTIAPRARLQAEIVEAFARHRQHRDADAAARRPCPAAELRQQLAHGVDRHGEADADVALGLRALVMIAVFMPITSPRTFSSGPPELPGLIAASVCSISFDAAVGDAKRPRCVALITPTADRVRVGRTGCRSP